MFRSALLTSLALLSLGGITNSVGGSTPSNAPAIPAIGDTISVKYGYGGEASNMTIYSNGLTHVISDEASSFLHEIIVVKDNTNLLIEGEGFIRAPVNGYKYDTDWPAVRLSIGSLLDASGGSITGSFATLYGMHGGEAIELYNGQYSPETASFAYFYNGTSVIGGDASGGVGGNALHVHGFGTEARIYGGRFKGGKGSNGDDGLSISALNGGDVHIYSGVFEGDMEVGDSSSITFYGCFLRDNTKVTGVFVDETYLEVDVRLRSGGRVNLISVAEQECETAPSASPTNFPTMSFQPTVIPPNDGRKNGVSSGFIIVTACTLILFAIGLVS